MNKFGPVLLAGLLGAMQIAIAAPSDNVDTGIRPDQCFVPGSNALALCNATTVFTGQDGQLGRDIDPATNSSKDGKLGFSFTKVCNSGEDAGTGSCPVTPALGPGQDDWACDRDKITGIMWEVKTATGPRAFDLTYTNYSRLYDPVGEYGAPTDAAGYVKAVNQSLLCGFDDWDLAHTAKIQSIIDYGIAERDVPRAVAGLFPMTQPDWYWNNSPNPSAFNTAFAVNFLDGAVDNFADRSTRRHAQVLRNGKTVVGPNGRFEISADGSEVTDTTVNAQLIWKRCVEGMTWDGSTCSGTPLRYMHEAALRHAQQVANKTGVAWRVPSIKELNWLVERTINSPPLQHDIFPATPAQPSWSSTPEVRWAKFAWAVDFNVGLIVQHPRTQFFYLRLARDRDD